MSGILAWAADMVGGASASDDEADDARAVASVMTPEQRLRAAEIDVRRHRCGGRSWTYASGCPRHVSRSECRTFTHTLAPFAALLLQLNAQSSTKEQA